MMTSQILLRRLERLKIEGLTGRKNDRLKNKRQINRTTEQ